MFTNLFTRERIKTTINALSSIKQTNPGLYGDICKLRELIATTGNIEGQNSAGSDNRAKIQELLQSPQNSHGEFHQYWFDEVVASSHIDPSGNNAILLAVARGAFNAVDRDTIVVPMVNMLLDDAASKLDRASLQEVVSFKTQTSEYYIDNSPLTLAIEAGLTAVAIKLLDLGSNPNVTCYGNGDQEWHGKYTPAHLVMLRMPLSREKATEVALLKKLQECGAEFDAIDNLGRSVKDLANVHNVRIEDLKCFRFKSEKFAQESGKDYRSVEDGLIRSYSFKELRDEGFKKLYGSEKILPELNEEGFHEFKKSIKPWLNLSSCYNKKEICDIDTHPISYDKVMLDRKYIEDNFGLLCGSEITPCATRQYPHNDFHGTSFHE